MGSAWMRSRWDRRIAGICGGIAQNQGWNSTVIRLVWVCLVLFGGTGILAYLVLWVVLPEEPAALPPYAGYAPPIYPAGYGQAPYPPAPPAYPTAADQPSATPRGTAPTTAQQPASPVAQNDPRPAEPQA